MSSETGLGKLNQILSEFENCAIAFSGGVDSTFLLAAAVRVLGSEKVTALTAVPPYVAGWEIREAGELAAKIGVQSLEMKIGMPDGVQNNPVDRCYICKTALFSGMLKKCGEMGIEIFCDGSNADDRGEYRPGMKALKELGIRSPLLEAGMTKNDIRSMSRKWNLDTWDKPQYACLLTRIPHNTPITKTLLDRIEKSEVTFIEAGFPFVRVRHHGEIARIEIPQDRFDEFISGGFYRAAAERLKSYGYSFVTLDLNGYKTGSMNPKGED